MNSSRSRPWFYLRFDFHRNLSGNWMQKPMLGGKVWLSEVLKFYDFGKAHLVDYDYQSQNIISCLRGLFVLISFQLYRYEADADSVLAVLALQSLLDDRTAGNVIVEVIHTEPWFLLLFWYMNAISFHLAPKCSFYVGYNWVSINVGKTCVFEEEIIVFCGIESLCANSWGAYWHKTYRGGIGCDGHWSFIKVCEMLSFSYPRMFLFEILCRFTAAQNIGVGVGLQKKHCRPLEVFVRAQSKPSAKFGIEAPCAMCSPVWLGWCLSSASWSRKYVLTSPNISQVSVEMTLLFCANLFCFLEIGDFLNNNRW